MLPTGCPSKSLAWCSSFHSTFLSSLRSKSSVLLHLWSQLPCLHILHLPTSTSIAKSTLRGLCLICWQYVPIWLSSLSAVLKSDLSPSAYPSQGSSQLYPTRWKSETSAMWTLTLSCTSTLSHPLLPFLPSPRNHLHWAPAVAWLTSASDLKSISHIIFNSSSKSQSLYIFNQIPYW